MDKNQELKAENQNQEGKKRNLVQVKTQINKSQELDSFLGDAIDSPTSAQSPIKYYEDFLFSERSAKKVNRNFQDRAFSKMLPGSLRGSIFALTASSIGTGCLSLPKAFSHVGIILATVLLIIMAIFQSYCMWVIVVAADMFKIKSYPALVERILGSKAKLMMNIFLVCYLVGAGCGYLICISTFVYDSIQYFDDSIDLNGHRVIFVLVGACVAFPMTFLRNLQVFRFISIIGILALSYATAVLLVEAPMAISNITIPTDTASFYAKFDLNIFSTVALFSFAFINHFNILTISSELKNSNVRRMTKVTDRTVLVLFVLYLTIGLVGFISLENNTGDLFIDRDKPKGVHSNLPMVIAKMLFSCSLSIVLPLNVIPCRQLVCTMKKITEPTMKQHIFYTAAIDIVILLLAAAIPDVLVVFGALGGLFGISFSCLFPTLMFIKLNGFNEYRFVCVMFIVACTVFTIMGYTSVVLSILKYIIDIDYE